MLAECNAPWCTNVFEEERLVLNRREIKPRMLRIILKRDEGSAITGTTSSLDNSIRWGVNYDLNSIEMEMSLPTNLNTVHFRAWSSICEFTAVADLCACYLACYKLTLAAKAKIFTPLLPPDICTPRRPLHHTPKHYHGKTVLAVLGLPIQRHRFMYTYSGGHNRKSH